MLLYMRLAWRNVWRHRRRTIIIVVAMGLGLAFMMIYDGLMDGFNQAIYGNAIRVLGGNIQIHAAGYREKVDSNPLLPLADAAAVVQAAQSDPNVVAATRRIATGGLTSNHEGAFPISIWGIDPEAEAPVSLIAQHIADGRYLTSDDRDAALIGRGLAEEMQVKVGDRITITGSDIHKQNRQRPMTVVGIYDIGLPSNEKKTVYISLPEAQELYGLPGQSTEVDVTLKKVGQEAAVVAALSPKLPGYEVESWEKNYPELQTAVGNKNAVMTIFGIIIIVIAAIGILNLLLMAVYERTREIGLLGAIGLKPRQIAFLFLLEGTLIGVVGVAAGIAFGLVINGSLGMVGIDFGSSYSKLTEYMALISGRVYPTLGLQQVVSRALIVLIVSMLAALFPAWEASQREPAEALHSV
jgi:putative ABC transport system permease protein